jgi:DNA helicase HerA-like ATPase
MSKERNNIASVQNAIALSETMKTVNTQLAYEVKQYGSYVSSMENIDQRYWNADANRQWVNNNELNRYTILIDGQNNLLNRINFPEISLWRQKKLLYYRTNSGELIIDDRIETQKELSSRYGPDVYIVYDMNDVLKSNTQIRVNTVFIAVNCLPVVDQEIVETNSKYELLQYSDGTFKRNLLANTRYMRERLLTNNTSDTFTKKVMSCITERNSDCISPWIKEIATANDAILLLVGNKTLSEDLVVDKVIKHLFNTGIVVTLTDEMLQNKSFEEILSGIFCLHINKIPYDEKEREKLKELLISIVIHKSVLSNGHTTPIQVKVIVTIDEVDPFFKEMMEITKTLFIDTKENILQKLGMSNMVKLYKQVEESLNSYSYEIASIRDNPLDLYKHDNQKFLESLEENAIEELSNSENIQDLDPYDDDFEKYFPIREFHTYITGQTRIGKSSFLITLFMYYIQNLKSNVILFDVHGDLAKKAKMLVKDKGRLLYISNSLDKSYAASINLFKINDKSEKNISKTANVILGVLKQIKADESFTGLMEEALLRCIRVLLRKGDGSFYELYRFMNDKRNTDLVQYAKNCGNPLDEEYFNDYFNDTNTKNAIRRRLGRLLGDEDFMNMMSGDKSIDFEKELNTPGKIIIIDIAKGDMDSYVYYIRFIVEYILVLTLKRVNILKEERVMTHLILDEFDNFITSNGNIKTILKEAGKYNLFLTIAHQIISDIKDPSLKDTILSMTDAKIIFKNSNKTLDALNKTLNKKLDNVENLNKGECFISIANNDIIKVKNTTRFLDDTEEILDEEWKEHVKYQLTQNYRLLNPITTQPTEDELLSMIEQFKADFISKKLTESSCLYKLANTAPERFTEIQSDFDYVDTETKIKRPRIRQQELGTIFQLAFQLNDSLTNRKLIQMLKVKSTDDIFNQTDSGTRSGEFTDNGKTQTEQYYYFDY